MQVGGIGNSGLDSHSSASHHVTPGLHHDQDSVEKGGAMRALSVRSGETKAAETSQQQLSLMDMLKKTIDSGKILLGRLWGTQSGGDVPIGTREVSDGVRAQEAGTDPVVTLHENANHTSHVAAASGAVQPLQTQLGNNPYFTTHSDPGKVRENVFQKIRVKFRDAAGQLTKRFGGRLGGRLAGRFSGRSALSSRQQAPREDLRRRSRYKEDELEFDCVLTDDSYLLDSYDRKGEYSRLTTENRR